MKKSVLDKSKGQTLITLLVFTVVALTTTAATITISLTNTQATQKYSASEEALAIAQAGADNAVLRLLRNPSYTGETLTVGNGTATITISGTTITSEGYVDNFRRKIQVTGSFTGTVYTVNSWAEID